MCTAVWQITYVLIYDCVYCGFAGAPEKILDMCESFVDGNGEVRAFLMGMER